MLAISGINQNLLELLHRQKKAIYIRGLLTGSPVPEQQGGHQVEISLTHLAAVIELPGLLRVAPWKQRRCDLKNTCHKIKSQ